MKNIIILLTAKKRLFRILAAALCIAIISGAYIFYRFEEKSIRVQKENELGSIAHLKTDQLTNWIAERKGNVKIAIESPFFSKSIRNVVANGNDLILVKDVKDRLVLLKEAYKYKAVFLLTTEGKQILSTEPGLYILDLLTLLKVREAIENKKITFTDFYFCSTHNEIHYDIIIPVTLKHRSTPVAVMVFKIDPKDYLYPLIQEWPVPGESSETLLVKKDGDSVLFLNELRFKKNTALKLRIPLGETKVPAVQAVLGRTGIFEGIDYRGIKVLIIYRTGARH